MARLSDRTPMKKKFNNQIKIAIAIAVVLMGALALKELL